MPQYVPVLDAASFGSVVRMERKARGLSQQELARRCGRSQRFISELERGKATAELGKALGVLEELGLVLCIRQSDPASARRAALDRLVEQVCIELEEPGRTRAQQGRTSLADYLEGREG